MREVSGVSAGDFLVFVGRIGEDVLSRFRSGAASPNAALYLSMKELVSIPNFVFVALIIDSAAFVNCRRKVRKMQ